MRTIRVLLVDPSRPFLSAAASFLAATPGIKVVGRLGSAAETLEQVSALRPDVVLMELAVPAGKTLEAVAGLRSLPQAPRVVLVTAREEVTHLISAARLAVDGVVRKDDFCTELLPLLQRLFA